MNSIQKEIIDLLRASGSKLVRVAGKGGEVWRLPNGMTFVTRTGKAQEHGVTHELAALRRKLGDVDVAKLSAGRKAPSACIHNWQKRGAALFCTRCYDIKTNDEQPNDEQPKQEEKKMEPLKIVPAAPAAPAKNPRPKLRWTDEQLKILVEGFDAGMTPAETAVLLQDVRPGVTNNQVSAQVSRLKETRAAEKPKAQKSAQKKSLYKTHWTRAQDRALIDAYAQKLSLTEVTKRLQSVRPGVSEKQVQLHASELRARMRSLNGEDKHPGKGNGAITRQRGRVVPIEITKAGAPVAPSQPPPRSVGLAPTSAAKPQRALAKVTFEIEGKVRVVEVDAETARGMLRAAMEL